MLFLTVSPWTMGVVCATFFSEKLGLAPAGSCAELRAWLRPHYDSHAGVLRDVDQDAVLSAMRQDKKNDAQRINFILTRGPGAWKSTEWTRATCRPCCANAWPRSERAPSAN